MRRTLLLLSPVLSTCTLNPAFDPDPTAAAETTADAPTSGGETHGPDAQPTTTATETSTTAAAESTTAALTSTGTGTDTSTGADESTSGSTTADESTDTESPDPATCWDLPPDTWQAGLTVLEEFADVNPHDPVISPDGLALVYIANNDYRPFRSTRASRKDPFLNGVPFTLWGPEPPFSTAYPRFDLLGAEMLMSYENDIYFAAFKPDDPNNQYSFPKKMPGPVNTPKEEALLTVTEDGTTLIVQRDETMPMQPFPYNRRFYQFSREDPKPGGEFKDGQDVTPYVGPHGFALCPALSPDGLHLFFSSTDSADFTPLNIADVVQIFHTTRDTLTSGWDPAIRLDAIAPGGAVLCPTSVTADGCALVYVKFEYGDNTTLPYTMYLLERTP